ncbi:MAG: shikimate kinase [Candidatus Bathyarchaeia archaeon]|nr:shikimate kinase [Candidatus Bathyarchaeota archaeon]
MALVGRAVAHGAVTIINAISCGLGAALGINLRTEARVKLTNEPGRIEGKILSDPSESTILIEKAVMHVLKYFGVEDEYGARVETDSNIPIARGLKSSSVAANAIVLATVSALGESVDDLTAINLGVNASIEAGVTVTGAFDDACASYFGNIVVTNNLERRILRIFHPEEDYAVLIYVSPRKAYTAKSDVNRMKIIAEEIKFLHKMALSGEYWHAMTLNGLAYSVVLGYDPNIAIEALASGAIAAGLSGKGPAVAAVVPKDRVNDVRNAWSKYEGEVIETAINRKKAHPI